MSNVIDKVVVLELIKKATETRDQYLREVKQRPTPSLRRKIREINEEIVDYKRLMNS